MGDTANNAPVEQRSARRDIAAIDQDLLAAVGAPERTADQRTVDELLDERLGCGAPATAVPTTPDGNTLYAWQTQAADGTWSVVGVVVGGTHQPLIAKHRGAVMECRDIAEDFARETGQPLRFVEFHVAHTTMAARRAPEQDARR